MSFSTLVSGFVRSAERFPDRLALVVGDTRHTYRQLSQHVARIASTIGAHAEDSVPLAAILASRSATAYAGILGILASGRGYVPLNPKFPMERTHRMLVRSGCSIVIVARESLAALPALMRRLEDRFTVVLPDVADVDDLSSAFPRHRFVASRQMSEGTHSALCTAGDPEAVAYLLFTSGSTGEPKGVPVRHGNVRAYLDFVTDRYGVTEEDRCSQEFDLTFDLSVHDMFVCWEGGACLYVVPEKSVMLPAKFIRDHALTMWFSVPSVVGALARLRLLQPESLPSLRCSLFCGEPLPAASAQQWQRAASRSLVENLYGPTETTIAISQYRWDPRTSPDECVNGVVPIGWTFAGQSGQVIDEQRGAVPDGERGELCLAGSQVTRGYWNDSDRTRQQFIRLPDTGETLWYRTGDLVRRDPSGCLYYLGRLDHQVKIRGYRVELQEIDGVLRSILGTEQVVTVACPGANGGVEGVVAFACGVGAIDRGQVLTACRQVLPDYMVPKTIHLLPEMPLNANGKIDRTKLVTMAEGT